MKFFENEKELTFEQLVRGQYFTHSNPLALQTHCWQGFFVMTLPGCKEHIKHMDE